MDLKLIRDQADRRATRRSLVRTADRSEKIRTYNYPQVRTVGVSRTFHLPYEIRIV
jgi:protein subunit release factor A